MNYILRLPFGRWEKSLGKQSEIDIMINNWKFMYDSDLTNVYTSCPWRYGDTINIETVVKHNPTGRLFRISELICTNKIETDVNFIEEVEQINSEFIPCYQAKIYKEENLNLSDAIKEMLLQDYLDECLSVVRSSIIDVDLDSSIYEQEEIIKISDKFFKLNIELTRDNAYILSIKKVNKVLETIEIYK